MMRTLRRLATLLGLVLIVGLSAPPTAAVAQTPDCLPSLDAFRDMRARSDALASVGMSEEQRQWHTINGKAEAQAAARVIFGAHFDESVHGQIDQIYILSGAGKSRVQFGMQGTICGFAKIITIAPIVREVSLNAAATARREQATGSANDETNTATAANSQSSIDDLEEDDGDGDDEEGDGSSSDFGAALSTLNAGHSMTCVFSAEDANRPGARGSMRMMAGENYTGDIAKEHSFTWDGSRSLSIDGNASTLVYEDGEVVAAHLLADAPLPPSRLPNTFSEQDQQGWQKLMGFAGALMNADAAQTGYKDRVIVLDFANRTGTIATWQNRTLSEAQAVECM